ncbi:ADP-ribosyltransferase, partial [Nocardiopsis ansamitocini]|uniref:ADP-ribosyltransferase n=1 Tax=Nocardiopsis ansamitocini TaxID=1670832 RepID=UPI0025564403
MAAANTAVVRYETTLENTRIDRGLFYTDLGYLGSMVVAAQLRLDAAHAQTRLAQAETLDAHNDTPLAQNRAKTITEHAAAETRTAQNDLDTAHTAYQQEGGTYTPDNTPTTTLIPTPTPTPTPAPGQTTTNGETTNQTATRDALSPEAATHTGANDLHVNMAGTPDPNDTYWTDPAYYDPNYYDTDTLNLASDSSENYNLPSFLTRAEETTTPYSTTPQYSTTQYSTTQYTGLNQAMDWTTPATSSTPTYTTWPPSSTDFGSNPTGTYLTQPGPSALRSTYISPDPSATIQQLKNTTPILSSTKSQTVQKILDAYKNGTLTQLAQDTTFQPRVDLYGIGATRQLLNFDDKNAFLNQVRDSWDAQRVNNPELNAPPPTPAASITSQELKNAAPILKSTSDHTAQIIFDAYKNRTLTQLAQNKTFKPRVDLDGTGAKKQLQSSTDKARFLNQIATAWYGQRANNPGFDVPPPAPAATLSSTTKTSRTSGASSTTRTSRTSGASSTASTTIQQLKSATPILRNTQSQTVQKILDAYRNRTLTQLAKDRSFEPSAELDRSNSKKTLRNFTEKKAFLDRVEAFWNAQRSRDSALDALLSPDTGESSTTYAGPSIYTALTHTGPTPTPGIDPTTPATTGRSPIEAAQREVAEANLAVVRYETTLENTRIDRGLFYTDLGYLGSMVVAAQLRLDAAHAQTRLAHAETRDAHNDTPLAQNRATTITERANAETRTAQNDLDTAHTAYQQEGGTYTPDNTPTTTLIPTPSRTTDTTPDQTTTTETTNPTATRDTFSPEAATHPGPNDLRVNMMGYGATPIHPHQVSPQVRDNVAAALANSPATLPNLRTFAYPLLSAYYDRSFSNVSLNDIAARFTPPGQDPQKNASAITHQWNRWHQSGDLFRALNTLSANNVPVPDNAWTALTPPPPAVTFPPERSHPYGSGMNHAHRFADNSEGGFWSIRHLETTPQGQRIQDVASADEVQSLRAYARDDFDQINSLLRGTPTHSTPDDRARYLHNVANLDALTTRVPVSQAFLAQRGVNSDYLFNVLGLDETDPGALVGTVHTEPAYMSLTMGSRSPLERDAYLMVRVPAGAPGLSTMPFVDTQSGENEFGGARGYTFVVHAAYQREAVQPESGDTMPLWFVEIELVPTGWTPPPGWQPSPLGDAETGYQQTPGSDDSDSDGSYYNGSAQVYTAQLPDFDPTSRPAPETGPATTPVERAREAVARANADLLRHETTLHEQRVRNDW